MKRVLVISGSPRKTGNTFKVTREFEDRVGRRGKVEFEYLFLKTLNLQYCRGCLVCMKKGEERCPCKDNSVELRDRLLAADGVVFASPVYVHTVSALMKNFYDRFAYLCHQPRFRDKAAALIVTTELSGGEETLQYMDFPAFTWGFRISAGLSVVYPGFAQGGRYRERAEREIDAAADAFYRDLTTPRGAPRFRELAFFHLLKTKVTLHRELLPRDYGFWQERGWLDREFYDEDNLPWFKLHIARALVKRRAGGMLKRYGLQPASGT